MELEADNAGITEILEKRKYLNILSFHSLKMFIFFSWDILKFKLKYEQANSASVFKKIFLVN